jgi:hypothetical protein
LKDAKGHGSDKRDGSQFVDVNGKSIIPSRPYREGTAHQVSIAEKHGVPTDHLVNVKPVQNFGKRNTVPAGGPGNPNVPAHQSRIAALIKEFAKSTTGAGKVPEALKEFDFRTKEPSDTAELAHGVHHVLATHGDPHHASTLVDFLRFLGFLGAIAIIDILALGMGLK